MTDRELLERAAKAAGLIADFDTGDVFGRCFVDSRAWNPLTDDGDALRLAVKLNMTISYNTDPDGPFVQVAVPWHNDFLGYWWNEWLHKDAAAATRRAIVRAAAAIGGAA